MEREILINDFATRSFRDVADQDYIAARLSYRHGLYPQFHWQSLQALEKYLKAILLYNRVKAKSINHDLDKALKLTRKLPFQLSRSSITDDFIKHLSNFGRFRYLESSYFIKGPKLAELDKAVWEIRRYCKVLDYDLALQCGNVENMFQHELDAIEKSKQRPPQKFRIAGGLLEKIIDQQKHPSRSALVWQNLFFGKVVRRQVRMPTAFHAVNAPLYLHPEILDEVLKYVFLPDKVAEAYREHGKVVSQSGGNSGRSS
ncbi:HEPN domain-containing protein [Marinobacter pelagius]|uniref:HEPN domain-containing protein n=1 Tax=Marinobacter sp. C7 TaxID=2951363 RepID=UPI001EF0936C|nr:HEPN domain-containing protein [Marinobacter sp. C7]MCG7201193.1 HEPN domain-containing protein [Marinobacter sp. C7]